MVLFLLAGPGCRARRSPDETTNRTPAVPPRPAPVRLLRPAAPGSFVRAVERVRPALVNLHAPSPVAGGPGALLPAPQSAHAPLLAASPLRKRVERSLGTGVLFNRQGHLLTHLGIIRNASEIRARLHDGQVLPTRLVGRDDDTGIAVLQLRRPPAARQQGTPAATLGDSSLLAPGDWVVAAGDPFGAAPYVSAGLVSSPGSSKGMTLARPGYFSFIATDARINAANAGGALLNTAGEVVGINVTPPDGERPIGFAVPINLVRDVLPTLLEHGQVARSWLGLYVKAVTAKRARALGLPAPRGALVSEVVPGGPAAQAGLRPGDVILSFGGQDIGRHVELSFAAARTPTGKAVVVKIWRDGRRHALSVRPERKPQ
jgi:S1-C subfamily serine protease